MQTLILSLVAIGITITMAMQVDKWNRMSRTSSNLGHARNVQGRIKETSETVRLKNSRVRSLLVDVLIETKIFPYNDEVEKDVNKMLVALETQRKGVPKKYSDVYLEQCMWGLSSILIAVLVSLAYGIVSHDVTFLGCLALPAAPFLFKMPVTMLRDSFKRDQLTAMSQWLEFYNMYYAQFSQTEFAIQLEEVVTNFLPLANPPLNRMLKRFNQDISTYGEEKALDRFKKRYPENRKVHKFVSVAKMRQNGDPSAFDLMKTFQDDLVFEMEIAVEKDLKGRLSKADKLSTVIIMTGVGLVFGMMVFSMVKGG